MLFLHWVGNRFLSLVTNVLYNTTLSDMETCYKLFDRTVLDGITLRPSASSSNPRSRPRSCAAASASTRCRSRTPAASSTRARRSPGATASSPSGPSSSTASRCTERGRTAGRRADPTAAMRARRPRQRVGRGGRELRGGVAAARLRALAARRRRAPAPPRSWSSTTARRDGSVAALLRGAPRRHAWSSPAATSGTRRAANRGIAATTAPVVAVCNADLVVRARDARRRCSPASTPSPISPPSGPRCFNPDGSQYPSARAHASTRRRRRPRPARAALAPQPLHPSLPPARRRLGPAPRRRLGVGRGDVPAPERDRLGRRLGRAVLHVRGGRRPLLAPAPARAGGSPTSRAAASPTSRGRARRGARTG